MKETRLRVLVLSDLFPNPARPAFGIFVERQTFHLQRYSDNTVVAPVRIFPHAKLWKQFWNPQRFALEWKQWRIELGRIPQQNTLNGIPVYYQRYTSPPRQVFHGVWGFFAYVFLVRKLRTLHRQRPFHLIHAHYASPSGVIALLARRWMRVPVVLSVHGSDVTYTALQNPLSAAIIRWVFRNVDAIIANSTWTARRIVSYGGSSDKVQIVHLGGDGPQGLARDSRPTARAAICLLSVGYLERRKGHAYVLRAVRQLRDAGYALRYVIVGDGSQQQELEMLAKTLGISDIVSFEGYKSHSAVWSYFADCDIFVLPSWDEAFGLVYVEALSYGKPVVGCKGEGGPEELKALGDAIELVNPRDVASIVQALQGLMDHPERRREMGEIGRQIVAKYFTWAGTAESTFRVYQRVLERIRG